MKPTVAIGADHAGFELKEILRKWLEENNFETSDFGVQSSDAADYPDTAHPLAEAVEHKKSDLGVLLCGSANGMAITANKHQGIRAAICWNEELASLARQHNNANVLCLPARFISTEQAVKILEQFLQVNFEGGRHQRRVEKISC